MAIPEDDALILAEVAMVDTTPSGVIFLIFDVVTTYKLPELSETELPVILNNAVGDPSDSVCIGFAGIG
jgi:hypothetical protein